MQRFKNVVEISYENLKYFLKCRKPFKNLEESQSKRNLFELCPFIFFQTLVTQVEIRPTSLRLDPKYSFYYVNVACLLVTGVGPFVVLALLNGAICR